MLGVGDASAVLGRYLNLHIDRHGDNRANHRVSVSTIAGKVADDRAVPGPFVNQITGRNFRAVASDNVRNGYEFKSFLVAVQGLAFVKWRNIALVGLPNEVDFGRLDAESFFDNLAV